MLIYKTISYCIMHFIVAFIVAYALTRDLVVAASIGVIEPIVQTFAYAAHERFWAKKIGKKAAKNDLNLDDDLRP